jgi:chromosome segregation ATPase
MFWMFNLLNTLKMCSVLLIVAMCISCVATAKKDEDPLDSRIMAENSSIKKRLPLIERENDVLRKENHQHRIKTLALETQIRNLELELAFLGEKYNNDMDRGEMQIKDLQLTIQKIEKESSERIESLIALKAALEKKLARKVRALNKKIVAQKKAYHLEREQTLKENAKRESSLSSQIEALKKNVETKDMENAALKKANSEISKKLSDATALTEALKKSRDAYLVELETIKATNARLTKALNSQQ